MNLPFEFTIEPPSRWPTINFRELWRFRDLFLMLAWRDIAIRYKQTALGVLWVLLVPFIQMVVFTFIFNRMGGITSGSTIPYPIFLYVGLLLWKYYDSTLTNASNSMVANAAIVQKVYFPRLIMPATAAITGLVDLLLGTAILVVMMIYYHVKPPLIGYALLPVLLLITFLASLGLGMFLAALNIKYRDVRYALPFVIQLLMYLTPVIYPVKLLAGHPLLQQLMIWLNPMAGVITVARAAVLGTEPIAWSLLGISATMSVMLFIVGLAYFRITERYFADII